MRKLLKYGIVLMIAVMMCMAIVSASAASYILGDADNDGEVTIIDATTIQRVLAFITEDPDGGIALRGDIDRNGELESIDAVYIMRYNIFMDIEYPIGEVIEEPTEPETEAPTQAPTQAPTEKPTTKRDPYELPPV